MLRPLISLFPSLLSTFALAHGRGLDKNGCHSGSEKYHCNDHVEQSELPEPGTLLEGKVKYVSDGDTIEVNGQAIRISALDCPERGTNEGESANEVAQKFLWAKAKCELTGAKTYDRLVAYCIVGGKDFGLFMMRNSACKVWEKYDVWDRY